MRDHLILLPGWGLAAHRWNCCATRCTSASRT